MIHDLASKLIIDDSKFFSSSIAPTMKSNREETIVTIGFILITTVILCKSAEFKTIENEMGDSSLVPYQRNRTPLQQMIQISITNINGNAEEPFLMRVEDSTSELYRNAESIGILDSINRKMVLSKTNSRVIPDDPFMSLIAITPPSRQLVLKVLAAKQIRITIHITNGNVTKSFGMKAKTRSKEVYQKAVDIGIMDNCFQFSLRYQYGGYRVLIDDFHPSMHQQILLDCIDMKHPNELRFFVAPFPEGVLLYALFQDMAPNQDIPSWNYAQFCVRNPWHVLCASLSRRIEYEDGMHPKQVLPAATENIGHYANDIYVVNVPMWSGVLHLQHTPKSVRSMTLKGHSVRVNLQSLHFCMYLKELTLDFDEIIGFDIVALSGSSLEILRFPSHPGLQECRVDGVLELLTAMRGRGDIRLDKIDFGQAEIEQNVIWFNKGAGTYEYIHVVSTGTSKTAKSDGGEFGSNNSFSHCILSSP